MDGETIFSHRVSSVRLSALGLWSLVGLIVAAAIGVLLLARPAVPSPPQPIVNAIGMKLALIPPGIFLMGSPKREEERGHDEIRHRVKITRPFYLGAYEVTQAQHEVVTGTNPSWFTATGGGKVQVGDRDARHFPVEDVTWHQAIEFCRKLSELPEEMKAGHIYRLPTEAEWEYACRAETVSPFHHGYELDFGNPGDHAVGRANMNGLGKYPRRDRYGGCLHRTCTVGGYEPNAFGLYDMHGNVQEWCADWYGPYATDGVQVDPQGPSSGTERVMRGGAFLSTGKACRSAQRNKLPPQQSHYAVGFRVVMEKN